MKYSVSFLRFFIFLTFFFIFFNGSAQKDKKTKDFVYHTHIIVSPEIMQILQETKTANYVINQTISLEKYKTLTQKTLTQLENRGFPFASVFLDSIFEKNDTVFAQLVVEKNLYCSFDTISVRGNLKVSKNYLKAYFNYKNKKTYNESIVKQIPQLVQQIPFVEEKQNAVIEFVENSAVLYLFLDKKRVNQFDGYIGVAPVSESSGKIAVYGEMNLHLMNLFTIGETIDLQWKAPEHFSQYLELKATLPYLLGTPIGVDGLFMLDKKDTTYLNMNYIIGPSYFFKGYNYARVYFDYSSSNMLDKSLYEYSDYVTYSDYRKTMYGFTFRFRNLDFIYNPRKGYDLNLNIAVGSRKIIENYEIDPSYYEGIDLVTVRYRMDGKIRGYIPLHRRWVLGLGAEGGALFGKQHLVNELFRLGGMNSLQGFEDLSIRASSYGIGLVELRFLVAQIAYINAFFNGAWYEQKIAHYYLHDFPFGFGAGIAFTTKAGLFYLSYALGKQLDNPISFKTGKIHFGLAIQF